LENSVKGNVWSAASRKIRQFLPQFTGPLSAGSPYWIKFAVIMMLMVVIKGNNAGGHDCDSYHIVYSGDLMMLMMNSIHSADGHSGGDGHH
jgi:hypothetical protein